MTNDELCFRHSSFVLRHLVLRGSSSLDPPYKIAASVAVSKKWALSINRGTWAVWPI